MHLASRSSCWGAAPCDIVEERYPLQLWGWIRVTRHGFAVFSAVLLTFVTLLALISEDVHHAFKVLCNCVRIIPAQISDLVNAYDHSFWSPKALGSHARLAAATEHGRDLEWQGGSHLFYNRKGEIGAYALADNTG